MDRLQLILNSIIAPLEWIMLFLVVGGGLLLVLHSRFYPLKLVAKSFKLLFSRESNKGISRFQALTAVLAATVGLGNISGVSIAIHMGGPGVLVWMWLTAIIGSTIKFYSSTLAVDLREFDKNGNPLKTRDGENYKLLQLFTDIQKKLSEINSDEKTVKMLSKSVLTYSDLVTKRTGNYVFDLEKFTNTSGKSAIFIQYSQVRAKRLLESRWRKIFFRS